MENSDFSLILLPTILFISLMLVIFGLSRILQKRSYRSGFLYYNDFTHWKKYCKKKI
jgi:hypothetical protein